MSGYPHQPSAYGYGAPPPPNPYAPVTSPYGVPPVKPQGQPNPYASVSSPYSSSYGSAPPYGAPAGPKPPKDHQSQPHHTHTAHAHSGYPPPQSASYYSPFSSLVPSTFPPGTDPSIISCFQLADQDGSGLIDDKEMQRALSSYNQSFSLRTVHLLMHHFTNTNARKIGPKEFTSLFYSLQNWRTTFERFDKDMSGKIDSSELREALLSMGFSVSPVVLDLLVSKFDKTGGSSRAIEYDNFIECCLTVKGLTEKFREKDTMYNGSATFSYESFMLTVLPFLIA